MTVFLCAESICADCGQVQQHRPDGKMRGHGCKLRLISRARHRAYVAGWQHGYDFRSHSG